MISSAFAILGSLSLFLFGMKVMSEGIQKVSGDRLRSIMQSMTSNRVKGVISGTFITTLVQSSSATTVMVVSFVNANLLKLRESVSIIMGANLGTTTTFWIISVLGYSSFKFSLSSIAIPIIGIGFPLFFLKNSKARDTGESLVGFGILILGLSFLKKSVPNIKDNPEWLEFLNAYAGTGYGSLIFFIFIGTVLTVIVQSSSAAGAITIAMTAEGWIPMEAACAMILGENIGTTITANLAAITGNVNSKRAARAHFAFNVLGIIWMLCIFYYFIDLVKYLIPGEIYDSRGELSKDNITLHISLFHTLFNFCNIIILLPFVSQIEKIATWLVKDSKATDDFIELIGLTSPGNALPYTGEMNLPAAEKELTRLSRVTMKMYDGFVELLHNPHEDRADQVKELKHMEELSDQLCDDITHHLVLCSTDKISQDSAMHVSAMLQIAKEMEDSCDACFRLIMQVRRKYRKSRDLLAATEEELFKFTDVVRNSLQFCHDNLHAQVDPKDLESAMELERQIDKIRKTLRKESVARMVDEESVKRELICITILNELEKIGNNCLNIIQCLNKNKPH